jgi:hypothetical protein
VGLMQSGVGMMLTLSANLMGNLSSALSVSE